MPIRTIYNNMFSVISSTYIHSDVYAHIENVVIKLFHIDLIVKEK